MIQFLQNIGIEFAQISLCGLGVLLLVRATRAFDLGYAGAIALAPYLATSLNLSSRCPPFVAGTVAIAFVALLGVSLDVAIYSRLRARGRASSSILLASLGMYIVVQNCISLLWGDAVLALMKPPPGPGNAFALIASGWQRTAVSMMTAISTYILATLAIRRTKAGLYWRAIAADVDLASACGILGSAVIRRITGASYAIAGLTGLLVAWDINAVPTMGLTTIMSGVVAALLGNLALEGVIVGAAVLTLVRQLAALELGIVWSDPATFAILCLALLLGRQKARRFALSAIL